MDNESQVTFSDISSGSIDEVYGSIVELSSIVTDEERDRAGDNCPTVTETTFDKEIREFSVKLPPKTKSVNTDGLNQEKYVLDFNEFVREEIDNIFVFVVNTTVELPQLDTTVIVEFVFPAENPTQIDDDSEENRTVYEQFDFKYFLEQRE